MDEQLGAGGDPPGVDELEQGVERHRWGLGGWVSARWARLPRTVRALSVALVGAVSGILLWQGLNPADARPAARPSQTAQPPLSLVLQAQGVCTKYAGEILQVGFRLTNVGKQPAHIAVVRPVLPLGMLLTLGVDYASPPCGSTSTRSGGAGAIAGAALAPGASQQVTFRLLPLVDCAAPAPVEAAVEVADDASPSTVTVPVLPDLGSVRFPGCTALTS